MRLSSIRRSSRNVFGSLCNGKCHRPNNTAISILWRQIQACTNSGRYPMACAASRSAHLIITTTHEEIPMTTRHLILTALLTLLSSAVHAELAGSVTMTGPNQVTACSDAKNAAQTKAELNRVTEGGQSKSVRITVTGCTCAPLGNNSSIWQCEASWSLQVESK